MKIMKKITLLKKCFQYRSILKSVIRSYLFFIENPEKSLWGSITREEEQGIAYAVDLANQHGGPIVEIGALFGHTTCLLASLKKDEVPLIAVENFTWNPFYLSPAMHRQFTNRTLRYVLLHCLTEIFDGNAADFYEAHSTIKPCMVFIDANHDYESVKSDIAWAVSTGCPVIAGHDYIDIHPGVIKAVNEFFGNSISLYGSVWVYNKKLANSGIQN